MFFYANAREWMANHLVYLEFANWALWKKGGMVPDKDDS